MIKLPTPVTHPNGLQTLLVPREGTEAVTVQFFFRAGARYETPEINGLAHFTEHMVFKGGAKYKTAQEVADAINRVGGYTNAYTSHELTSFYVKLAADKAEVALDVLSDYLTQPHFDATELEKERGVIIEEINRSNDDPADQLSELMNRLQYPEQPLGRDVLGTKENIRSMPRQAFVDWTKTYFTPDRCLLAITGNVSAIDDALLEKYVGRFKGSSGAAADPAKPALGEPVFDLLHKDIEQSHLGLSLAGPSYAEREKSIVLDVLSMILGGNMSSRLFHSIREQQGLCYTIFSSPDQLLDDGSLYIYAGVPNDKIVHSLDAIIGELKRFLDDLTDEEVTIGKESLKGGRALRWEESSALGTYYGLQQLMLGEMETTQQMLERIDAVTKEQILELGAELFKSEGLRVGIVGPQKKTDFDGHVTIA